MKLVAVPREWVPGWLWWWACHPIPFWPNELFPLQIATTRIGRKLLTDGQTDG